MGTWKNPQKGFTASERFPNIVADDCVRVTRRNHHAPRRQVTKRPPRLNFWRSSRRPVSQLNSCHRL
nr:hypothetical protein [Schleiferilactobacillus harbinensis]